ncbi:hypothetical protein Unana1_08371 [Umbelopsis nana]
MPIGWIALSVVAFSIQAINAVSLSSPFTGTALKVGITFTVSWMWDGLPNPSDDGTLDILLVKDVAATSVALTLDKGVSPLALSTSITLPLDTPSAQYYIQLKVTSGTEKSALNGQYTITGGPASSNATNSGSSYNIGSASSAGSIATNTGSSSNTVSSTSPGSPNPQSPKDSSQTNNIQNSNTQTSTSALLLLPLRASQWEQWF